MIQVKVAEHVLTRHKVAIKILNRRKIQAMDMEEKGAPGQHVYYILSRLSQHTPQSTDSKVLLCQAVCGVYCSAVVVSAGS